MINPPKVSLDLLQRMLFAESMDAIQQIVKLHPELEEYYQIAFPLHEALEMLLTIAKIEEGKEGEEEVEAVQVLSPNASMVILKNKKGERIASLYNLPAETLALILLKDLSSDKVLDVYNTLQVATHHPNYLTEPSYWMLRVMCENVVDEKVVKVLKRSLAALEICLEEGLDSQWMNRMIGRN